MKLEKGSDNPVHQKMITIIGPTASGKTTFAAHLAKELNAEIISGDSRQLYRGMDIGTGKDLVDYKVNGTDIPYHLIDICDAGEKYTLFDYHKDFHKAYNEVVGRDKTPILCGGTGLYIESVLKGYNLPDVPKNKELRESLQSKSLDELAEVLATYRPLHNTTDTENKRRTIRAIEIEEYKRNRVASSLEYPPIDSLIIGVNIEREARRSKISSRLKARADEGMVGEVENLLSQGVLPEDLIYYGLEYKFVTQYVIGQLTYEEMYSQLEIAIHQFAKRQMTWFRGMERRGFIINWIDASLPMSEKVAKAVDLYSRL